MTYGSSCSGIEGATVAWHPLGWRAAWYAEVDPFCCALLKHHYPEIPNHGDFTRIGHRDACEKRPESTCGTSEQNGPARVSARDDRIVGEPIDLLVGGTPCQSFSVAGKRAGLDDPRGNLTLEYLALAGRLRPRWLVWENVPGVLSIDKGRTFGTFLGILGQLGYGFAYRILDAQHFGVPQRRRRVFVVGHLGDWRRAAAVLFERASLSGHPAPSREAGERLATDLETSTGVCGPLTDAGGHSAGSATTSQNAYSGQLFAIAGRAEYKNQLGTLRAQGGDLGGGSEMLVANPLPGHHSRQDFDNDTYVTHSLRADGFDASEDGTGRGTPLIPIQSVQCVRERKQNGIGIGGDGDPMFTMTKRDHQHAIQGQQGVRRLTPAECEALQGFPRGYIAIPYRSKLGADGPRYRALGNSFAVPVVRWIGERIAMVDAL